MKYLLTVFAAGLLLFEGSCIYIWHETIKGNGNTTTEERDVPAANKIKSLGNFSVQIAPGTTTSVKVEADENLQPYILTDMRDGFLEIRTKNHVNLQSSNKIIIHIITPQLEEVELAGSGDITGSGQFINDDHLKASIAGSGNIRLDAHSPLINADIAGTGDIHLSGETRDVQIHIAGVGDLDADSLKAENAVIHIAGSGNVKIYAASSLDVHIAGSGDVYYLGSPSISQDIAGSGKIKPLQ